MYATISTTSIHGIASVNFGIIPDYVKQTWVIIKDISPFMAENKKHRAALKKKKLMIKPNACEL